MGGGLDDGCCGGKIGIKNKKDPGGPSTETL